MKKDQSDQVEIKREKDPLTPQEAPKTTPKPKPAATAPAPEKKQDRWQLPSWADLFGGLEKWVINYDPDRQMDILKGAGFESSNWLDLMITAVVGIAGVLSLYLGGAWYRGRKRVDPLTRSWTRFCERMWKLGLEKSSRECPKNYLKRIVCEQPEIAPAAEDIILRYIDIRYGENHDPEAAAVFIRQVQRFNSMV